MQRLFLGIMLCLAGSPYHGLQAIRSQPPRLGVQIEALEVKYRTEDSFKGIVEAFKKSESNGGRTFLRTQPDCREGLYFTVMINGTLKRILEGSTFVIRFITQIDPHEVTYAWVTPNLQDSLRNELYLGITGNKQYNSNTQVVCWTVTLYDPKQRKVCELNSFAWAMPSKN